MDIIATITLIDRLIRLFVSPFNYASNDMTPDYENRLKRAIRAHRDGLSVRAAAKRHAVSRLTLQRHLDGGQSICEAYIKQQNLSPRLEMELVR